MTYALWYRRRFLDGDIHATCYSAGLYVAHATAALTVVDVAEPHPKPLVHHGGWRSEFPRSRLFEHSAEWHYTRLWFWHACPLHIAQLCDAQGHAIVQRIDFATPALRTSTGIYQTDLYLDCFISADGLQFLVEDEDEVQAAHAKGLLSQAQQTLIENELTFILTLLRGQRWNSWINALAPTPLNPALLIEPRVASSHWLTAADHWPEDVL